MTLDLTFHQGPCSYRNSQGPLQVSQPIKTLSHMLHHNIITKYTFQDARMNTQSIKLKSAKQI